MPSIFKSSRKNKGGATSTSGPFALSFTGPHKGPAQAHGKAHRVPSASSLKGHGTQGEFGALPGG